MVFGYGELVRRVSQLAGMGERKDRREQSDPEREAAATGRGGERCRPCSVENAEGGGL
jgi:hypothetical protein